MADTCCKFMPRQEGLDLQMPGYGRGPAGAGRQGGSMQTTGRRRFWCRPATPPLRPPHRNRHRCAPTPPPLPPPLHTPLIHCTIALQIAPPLHPRASIARAATPSPLHPPVGFPAPPKRSWARTRRSRSPVADPPMGMLSSLEAREVQRRKRVQKCKDAEVHKARHAFSCLRPDQSPSPSQEILMCKS